MVKALSGSLFKLVLMRAAWVGVLGLSFRLVTMAKDICLANRLGVSSDLDVLLVALLIPMFVVTVFGQSLAAALLPALIRTREHQGPQRANELVREFSSVAWLILFALMVAILVGAPQIVMLCAWGFSVEQSAATASLLRITALLVLLSGLSLFWGGILNSYERFVVVALAPLATPLILLSILYVAGEACSVHALAIGTVMGAGVELLILALYLRRLKIPLLPGVGGHTLLRELFRQFAFTAGASLLSSSSVIIDQTLASGLETGSVTILNLGGKVTSMMVATCSLGLTTVAFPHFAQLTSYNDSQGIKEMLRGLIRTVLMIMIPVTALLMMLSPWIVRVLYNHGNVADTALTTITQVQICSLFQLPSFMVGVLLMRLLCAAGDHKLVLRAAAVGAGVNLVGDLLFLRFFGVAGIALATALVYACTTIVMLNSVRKRFGSQSLILANAVTPSPSGLIGSTSFRR